MEIKKRNLKSASFLVLFLTLLSVVRLVLNVVQKGGFEVTEVPAGMTPEVAKIVMIFSFAVMIVAMIPRLYVGVKGLKVANEPSAAKAHIVWAVLFLITGAWSMFNDISAIIEAKDLVIDILTLVSSAIDVFAYALFTYCALQVRKGA
jgi:hypothetical protein